ncbi:pentapeptide repeat-containing protein [Lentzea sp. NEAU-D13]|uniref:Pentapeptide repeat-containing protein n=1 Tax=Lentzea alba TaxID=2714351 RepID=A0A7C9RRX8_9PSEU|nr:pentapeptide repeat-containing protein [Lentzea alba]NGY61985.1 pentapeptide repeat-containing protein [Lentzea alba]
MIALVSAVTAVVATLVGYWNLQVSDRQADLTEQGQHQDRFDRAVERLGNQTALEVRLGAIMSFDRLVNDSPGFRESVVGMLAGFVREQAPAKACDTPGTVKPDIQAALDSIGKHYRSPGKDSPGYALNLRSTCLQGANLSGHTFDRADLGGSNLSGALLNGTRFAGAYLMRTNFSRSFLMRADFTCASIVLANFSESTLVATDMTGAELMAPNFQNTTLWQVNLSFATMTDVVLTPEQEDGVSRATTTKIFCAPPDNYAQAPAW